MLEGLGNILGKVGEDIKTFVSEKPMGAVAIGAGIVGTTALGISAIKRKLKRKVKKKAKRKTRRKKTSRLRKKKLTPLMKRRKKIIKRKGRQTPYTARGGKDRSTRRIRYTKNSQPYVILANGRARFISKASAKRSRKMKGGKY